MKRSQSILVVGSHETACEMVGHLLNEFTDRDRRGNILALKKKIGIVSSAPKLLPSYSNKVSNIIETYFRDNKVQVHLN